MLWSSFEIIVFQFPSVCRPMHCELGGNLCSLGSDCYCYLAAVAICCHIAQTRLYVTFVRV